MNASLSLIDTHFNVLSALCPTRIPSVVFGGQNGTNHDPAMPTPPNTRSAMAQRSPPNVSASTVAGFECAQRVGASQDVARS
jgi:hypothetical protein